MALIVKHHVIIAAQFLFDQIAGQLYPEISGPRWLGSMSQLGTLLGKKRKKMWTMLCQFKANSMGNVTIQKSDKSHLPLMPVCDGHLLEPDCGPSQLSYGSKLWKKMIERKGKN